MTRRALQVVLYLWLYLGWFACVLLGKYGFGIASLIVPAIGWILFWRALSPARRDVLKILLLCLGGIAADAAFLHIGVIHDPQGSPLPLWLASLWLLFAPAIYIFAGVFGSRFWLAALAGGIMGPLSYKSGEYFGVLEMPGAEGVLIYAVFWTCFLPLALAWVRKAS
ncbi:MAG: DUF2878 domain-containing protein [Alphaproteobacteria bacterium]